MKRGFFHALFLWLWLALSASSQAQLTQNQRDALELGQIGVGTSGGQGWSVVNDSLAIGGTALKSPDILDNNESTSVSLSVPGPGTLAFRWRVISEEFGDIYSVSVNTTEIAQINGETEWAEVELSLPAENNTVTWTFEKDADTPEPVVGEGAWLDDIFIKGLSPPQLENLASIIGHQNQKFFLQLQTSSETTAFELVSGTLPTGLNLSEKTGTLSGIPSTPGNFSATIRAIGTAGPGAPSEIAIEIVSEMLQNPGESQAVSFWRSGGNSPWSSSSDPVDPPGTSNTVLKSGAISHNQNSQLALPVYGPATISFRWRVDSEEAQDFLSISINGSEVNSISGFVDWTTASIAVPAGYHEVIWAYTKDDSIDGFSDAGWVDDVMVDGYNALIYAEPNLVNFSPVEDPDGDQVVNLWELYTGTLLTDSTSFPSLSPTIDTNGQVTLPFTARPGVETFIRLSSEISQDLIIWESHPATAQSGQPKATLPIDTTKTKFLRFHLDLD